MQNFLDFSGKVALVTGSTKGIGMATAKLFAEHGADVIINSRHRDDVDRVAKELRSAGHKAFGIRADVGEWEEVKEMMETIDRHFGRLDVIVNNAALRHVPSLLKQAEDIRALDDSAWNEMLRVNILGMVHTCKAGVELMKRGGGGSIINISSGAAVNPPPYAALSYKTSKGAILSFTRSLAAELAKDGIRVNAVMPILIKTETESRGQQFDPALFRALVDASLFGRVGTPDEVASVCLFLASTMASFISGEAIALGGGLKFYTDI